MFFFKYQMNLYVLFDQEWFAPFKTPMDVIFIKGLPCCGIV